MFQHVRGPNCSKPTPKKTLITGVRQRFLVEVCVKYFCWATGGAAVIDAVGGERDVSLKWLRVHVSMRQEVLCLHLFDVQSSAFLLLFFFSDDLSSSVSAAPHLLSQPPHTNPQPGIVPGLCGKSLTHKCCFYNHPCIHSTPTPVNSSHVSDCKQHLTCPTCGLIIISPP